MPILFFNSLNIIQKKSHFLNPKYKNLTLFTVIHRSNIKSLFKQSFSFLSKNHMVYLKFSIDVLFVKHYVNISHLKKLSYY